MSSFITLFRNDLNIIIKDFKALILILLLPVIAVQVFAAALSPVIEHNAFVEPFTIVLVDNDKSPWTGLLKSQLNKLEIVDKVILADEQEARRLIKNQKAAAAIILPENLAESIDYWDPQAGKVIGSNLLHFQSQLVKNIAFVGSGAVSAGLASLNVIYDTEAEAGYAYEEILLDINDTFGEYVNIILDRKSLIAEEKLKKPDVGLVIYYAMSLMPVFILFSSIPCMKLLTEERRLGILSRLNAAPAGSWQTIASKILVSFLISAVQFSLVLAFAASAGERILTQAIGAMVPVFLATTLAASAFSIFIASIAGSGSAADLIANLSILLMAVVGGSLYPLSSLPDVCRKLSFLTINRWSSEGFIYALFGESNAGTVKSMIGLLLLTCLFASSAYLILSTRRRRVGG